MFPSRKHHPTGIEGKSTRTAPLLPLPRLSSAYPARHRLQAAPVPLASSAGTYYGGRQVRDKVKQYLETDTGIQHGARANTPPARRLEVRCSTWRTRCLVRESRWKGKQSMQVRQGAP